MTKRRRTRRTLGLMLALLGLASAGWAYASLGPSSPRPNALVGEGRAVVELDGASLELSQTGLVPPRPVPGAASMTHTTSAAPVAKSPGPSPQQTRGVVGVGVGNVFDLYPGGRSRLPVTLTNPYRHRITVQRIWVRTIGTAGCRGRYFTVARHSLVKPRHIGAERSKVIVLPYRMKLSAPDGCQGVHAVVRVRVSAVTR